MTGLAPAVGSAETGDWVSDGLTFVLVDQSGQELARKSVRVKCSPPGTFYFPLAVGNEWVYRADTRFSTSEYIVHRVRRAEIIGEQAWFVFEYSLGDDTHPPSIDRFRNDAQGRVYRLKTDGTEELWFDPTPNPNPTAVLKAGGARNLQYHGVLGNFPEAVAYTLLQGLSIESGLFARGVGLVSSTSSSTTGSSGGFVIGLTLVYARIDGNLRYTAPMQSVELSTESTSLDVTGQHVTNCAVPCYFAACGLTPGADPVGTYKPCFRARVRVEGRPSSTVDLDLVDASDQSVVHTTMNITAATADSETVLYRQIALYTQPNQPVPNGRYQLRAHVKTSAGADAGTAVLGIEVK